MARNVCYAVEVEGHNIIITQQWPDKQIYIKMSRASAHWVAQQLWNIFDQKRQYDELPEKNENSRSFARKKNGRLFIWRQR